MRQWAQRWKKNQKKGQKLTCCLTKTRFSDFTQLTEKCTQLLLSLSLSLPDKADE